MAAPLQPVTLCIQCGKRERELSNGLCLECANPENPLRNRYILSLDPGKESDPAALAAVERIMDPERISSRNRPNLYLRGLQQWALGTPYPKLVRDVCEFLRQPPFKGQCQILVDRTGVGNAVVDIFHEQEVDGARVRPIEITYSGGDRPSGGGHKWTVPKRDLVVAMEVQLQNGRLIFPDDSALKDEFQKQLMNFKMKKNQKTGRDAYEAAKSSDHDDLVCSVAVASWWARHIRDNTPSQLPVLPR
jgi:hypothetical protein